MTKDKAENQISIARFTAITLEKFDAELLLACRTGDEHAWQILVGRFKGLVATIPLKRNKVWRS